MLRLSKLTDYAVAVLVRLDRCHAEGNEVATAPQLAVLSGIPEPTVAKVLKSLTACGMVASSRGARGGYRLTAALEDISLASVITALDGPIALITCVEGTGGCEAFGRCDVRGRWDPVNDAVRSALTAISLAQLRGSNCCGASHVSKPAIAARSHAAAPAFSVAE